MLADAKVKNVSHCSQDELVQSGAKGIANR